MRLSIRRKLIGTLMLVGLVPLALSLAVILGGTAAMRLRSTRQSYEYTAANAANQIAGTLTEELQKLTLLARMPQVGTYAQEQTMAHAQRRTAAGSATQPADNARPDAYSHALDARWSKALETEEPLRVILHNPLAERLQSLAGLDARSRQLLATDAYGELIAASTKPADYFQADETWWQSTFAGGKGQAFISSVVPSQATGEPVVVLAVPILDEANRVVGTVQEKIDIPWLTGPLHAMASELNAAGVIFDVNSGKTAVSVSSSVATHAVEEAYLKSAAESGDAGNVLHQRGLLRAVFGEPVIGAAAVPFDLRLVGHKNAVLTPQWEVIIGKTAQEAMIPVYTLGLTVLVIGVALILVLFILGVAISNREIIMPILRLREATGAVGRGELNIRLISEDQPDPTFRDDELGQLARDFDEMTRQLQKNVGALARSNEAKRRFMELAGHELRTPVTYILGVCQLAARQLQQMTQRVQAAADEAGDAATATTGRTGQQLAAAFVKIGARAQRLDRIIGNLLKLVNNDQFTTRLTREPIDLRALILQVCNDARPFVNERRQQLQCDVEENLPGIEGDRDKLEDALTNLVSNAIRFSPDGATVRIAARRLEDMLEILVQDAGPGIADADLQHLFEPFYTGSDVMHHHSGTIEYGSKGIGLGLAIVRRFIEIHGGTVSADSSPQGTTFRILLPIGPNRDLPPDSPEPSVQI